MQSLILPTLDQFSKASRFVGKHKSTITYFTSMAFVFLFVYTAQAKLTEHATFENMLAKTQVVDTFSGLLSWLIPITEIVISVLLIIPIFLKELKPRYYKLADKLNKIGLWSALIIMIIFTVYLSGIYLFAENHLCHCGGVIESMGWKTHIAFNFFFIAIGIISVKLNKSNNQ